MEAFWLRVQSSFHKTFAKNCSSRAGNVTLLQRHLLLLVSDVCKFGGGGGHHRVGEILLSRQRRRGSHLL